MFIDNLVEMHCHILPKIDDGSKDVETSLKMIKRLQAQGAKSIVLTPHFYTDSIYLNDFVNNRQYSLNRLREALNDNSVKLIPAAEVYITDYLFNNESIDELCIGNSHYMLTEHSFSCDFRQDTFDRLLNLYYEYKVKPVLAHIERYDALMEDEYLLESYIEMGCMTQVNIGSFADGPKRKRKKLFKYLENGLIHLIGSDCHNLDTRPPDYEKGVSEIIKRYGKEPINTFVKNANMLIK